MWETGGHTEVALRPSQWRAQDNPGPQNVLKLLLFQCCLEPYGGRNSLWSEDFKSRPAHGPTPGSKAGLHSCYLWPATHSLTSGGFVCH